MSSYRFARRSFLGAVGGAVGLKLLLRNLEASAQGVPSPPRLMVAFWPCGTIRYMFRPSDPAQGIATSRILKPFADAGLGNDMIALLGLQTQKLHTFGGGSEAGMVMTTTGALSPGTRVNGGETDDTVAGGPSFDQIFLKNVPALQRPGIGYANAICDSRVDSFETSAQCMSYSYATRSVAASQSAGAGTVTENVPLMPTLQPLKLFTQLFAGFSGTPLDAPRIKNLLRARKSVLDHSLRELARLRTVAPASESARIDQHAEVIRKSEIQLASQIDAADPTCAVPAAPDASLIGKTGSRNIYGSPLPLTSAPENALHEQIGKTHAALIRAAFQCDLIRVATFQWAPGASQVAFGGLFPPDLVNGYPHHPMTHAMINPAWAITTYPPASDTVHQGVVDFLANVHTWYNQKTADILVDFKNSQDVFGGNLLDNTIVPFVTDIATANMDWSYLPALIFGGRRLGMNGGQYLELAPNRPQNDMWMTIAQAFLKTTNPVAALPDEVFVKTGVAPIAGLWTPPT